jgi:hypothetical protein
MSEYYAATHTHTNMRNKIQKKKKGVNRGYLEELKDWTTCMKIGEK